MPNHIHVLWEQLKMNKKETPKESFEKFTGHVFLKRLRLNKENLKDYATQQKDRNYLFWQRDPLAIQITSRIMAGEKLDYMPVRMDSSGRTPTLYNLTGNYVKILLSIDFHQPDFTKQERTNLRF